jgi:predicted alpha-1,2-mannosidase
MKAGVIVAGIGLASAASAAGPADPVAEVDPNIGTLGYKTSTTSPTVQLPHGMMRVDPVFTPGVGDKYLADKIHGFSLGNGAVLTPVAHAPAVDRAGNASSFDHDFEVAGPHHYQVRLEDGDIRAETTVTAHAAQYRFLFQAGGDSHVALTISGRGDVQVVGSDSVEGSFETRGATTTYFRLEFRHPFAGPQTWADGDRAPAPVAHRQGTRVGLGLSWSGLRAPVEARAAISFVSLEQARANLKSEIPAWSFEKVRDAARAVWNRALSRVRIEGGTAEQRRIFYTSLYRALCHMTDITEGGQYFGGMDRQVHQASRPYYTGDQLWDTFRTAHPLQVIVEPERQSDVIASYLRMYEQGGFLPSFPSVGGHSAAMIGHHVTILIADAYGKGHRDFDVQQAYQAMRQVETARTKLPWREGPATELDRFYDDKGYFPALPARKEAAVADLEQWHKNVSRLVGAAMPYQITWLPEVGVKETVKEVHPWHRRQSVSVTLEEAYDDWAVAQMARALDKNEDAVMFGRRAGNYRNLFDPRIGFMAPRSADGKWVEPFDPKLSGGFAGEGYFAECNSWIYTFSVQHDVPGLIALMGGPEPFMAKLDRLFVEQYGVDKPAFWGQFPDMSGLIGNYAQGNEPSFHIPYLYNYAGAPWKTQRRVREIMKIWYNAGPQGLSGDDDMGALSSWYVLSAMGFYPVAPGRPVYDIGSPLFRQVTIALPGGKTFVLEARGVSAQNKYVQSAALNGKPLDSPWFDHADLARGGRLRLIMGPRPNKQWGAQARPPG